jgi:DNA polymerase I-like protein with 3'-5' exonuclease and polymerase domains
METEGINLDVFFLEKTCGDAENWHFRQKNIKTAGEKFNLASPNN